MDDSPYSSPRSANDSPAVAGGPNASTPKTIGVLNIVFGTLLLTFCGLCYGGGTLISFLAVPALLDSSKTIMDQAMKQQQDRIDKLKAELETAETDEEKATLQTQIDMQEQQASQLAQNPAMQMDTEKFKSAMHNPTLIAYYAVDVISGVLLNLLMLISGVWLMKYRTSGLKLATKVFAAKIIRLVLLQGANIVFVLPISLKMNQEMIGSQKNNPFAQFGGQSMASGIAMAVAMLVLGCIYPAIGLILLNKPENKAACNRP